MYTLHHIFKASSLSQMPPIHTYAGKRYENSPLAGILHDLAQKIDSLKSRYFPNKTAQNETPEAVYAFQVLKLAEKIVETLHTVLFPAFSEGGSPGLIAIARLISNVHIIRQKVHQIEELFKRLHPGESKLIYVIGLYLSDIINRVGNEDISLETLTTELKNFKTVISEEIQFLSANDFDSLFNKIIDRLSAFEWQNVKDLPVNDIIFFVSRYLSLYAMTPKHPSTYELLQLSADIISDLPEEIPALAPFLNPAAFVDIFKGGLIGFIKNLIGHFQLTHTNDFTFEIQFEVVDRDEEGKPIKKQITEHFDAQQRYRQREEIVSQVLKPLIRRYLAGVSNIQHLNPDLQQAITKSRRQIKSEVAYTTLLQNFTQTYIASIKKDWTTYHLELTLPKNDRETNSYTLIQNYKNNAKCLYATRQLQKKFTQQKQDCSSRPFRQLLDDSSLTQYEQEDLDLSLCDQGLPNQIDIITPGPHANGDKTVDIKKALISILDSHIQELARQERRYQNQNDELKNSIQSTFERNCKKACATLEEYQQQVAAIMAPINLAPSDIAAVELSLEEIDKNLASLVILQTTCQTTYDQLVSTYDASLQIDLDHLLQPVAQALIDLKQNLESSQTKLSKDKIKLQAHAEKLRSDVHFTKSLRSADPATKQALLREELDVIRDQKSKLQPELTKIKTKLATQHQQITEITQEKELNQTNAQKKQQELHDLEAVIQHLSAKIKGVPEDCDTLLGKLRAVQAILQQDKTPKFSFAKIETHMDFHELLTLLGQKQSEWDKYRKRQETLFNRNPSHSEFNQLRTNILTDLSNKITGIETFIEVNPKIQHHLQQKEQTNLSIVQLRETSVLIESKLTAANSAFEESEQEKQRSTLELLNLDKKESLLQLELGLTEKFTITLQDIKTLRDKIEQFESNEDFDSIQQQKDQLLADLQSIDITTFTSEQRQLITDNQTVLNTLRDQLKQRILLIADNKTIRAQATLITIQVTDYDATLTIIPANTQPNVITSVVEAERTEQHHSENSGSPEPEPQPHREMVDKFLIDLDLYQKNRDKQYYFKDLLTSTDKITRARFIKELKQKLVEYKDAPINDAIIAVLQNGIAQFPGKNLRSLLHAMLADILSLGQQNAQTDNRETILAQLKEKHPQYGAKLQQLYDNITQMQHYGETLQLEAKEKVTQLATTLKQDTDHFLEQHGEKPPEANAYEEFSKKFTARLHSADHVMSAQDKDWKYMLTNITLILFLIPKLLYSKLTSGRCAFFSEKSTGDKLVDTLENSVHNLGV